MALDHLEVSIVSFTVSVRTGSAVESSLLPVKESQAIIKATAEPKEPVSVLEQRKTGFMGIVYNSHSSLQFYEFPQLQFT